MQIAETELFKKYGAQYNVDYLLMAAQGYQESTLDQNVKSPVGAVGIMQVMPATAAADGPALLNRQVNLFDPADNIDMGAAILKHNLDHWHGDLASALVAYYAGGAAVTDWGHLRDDERRYVWSVYRMAVAFRDGKGPV